MTLLVSINKIELKLFTLIYETGLLQHVVLILGRLMY